MKTEKVWRAVGFLWGEDEARSKAMQRTVLFTAGDHVDAFGKVEGALLHNWSEKPHKVDVQIVQKVYEKGSDQQEVIVT